MVRPLDIPGIHVAMISPEVAPFSKTGGLGDVLSALPKALDRLGVKVSVITPAYRSVTSQGIPLEDTGLRLHVPVSDRFEEGSALRAAMGSAITVYFIRADNYFGRDYLYGTPEADYPDNADRFVFLSRAALEILNLDPPQILHAHDWQSALAIVFLKAQPQLYPKLTPVKTVFTTHNLAYQGIFTRGQWHLLNLDPALFTPRYLEFWGKINFLKGGLVFADALTTVSRSYAEEVKTPEYGFGLEGVFRERAASLTGILNGADYDIWNPETDQFIKQRYGLRSISRKAACKRDLQQLFSLPQKSRTPLIGMVSRLTPQKGFDLLKKSADGLLCRDLQLVVVGAGDSLYENWLSEISKRHPERIGVKLAFDELLAHRVMAGSDMYLMPSRYEPSGLTQIYAMRYGAIPIVRATGGLRDTVIEFNADTGEGNGLLFSTYDAQDLARAVDEVLELFTHRKTWLTVVRNAMTADFSWQRSAQAYFELYRKLLAS